MLSSLIIFFAASLIGSFLMVDYVSNKRPISLGFAVWMGLIAIHASIGFNVKMIMAMFAN